MKTLTELEVLEAIGMPQSDAILSGNYGDATKHANGFVVCDPCYCLDDATYKTLCRVATEQAPVAYNGQVREWVEISYPSLVCPMRVFFISCSDGVGPFSHCVDSGWVAAIPLDLIAEDKKKRFKTHRVEYLKSQFNENDCGGVFDGHGVVSDADPAL